MLVCLLPPGVREPQPLPLQPLLHSLKVSLDEARVGHLFAHLQTVGDRLPIHFGVHLPVKLLLLQLADELFEVVLGGIMDMETELSAQEVGIVVGFHSVGVWSFDIDDNRGGQMLCHLVHPLVVNPHHPKQKVDVLGGFALKDVGAEGVIVTVVDPLLQREATADVLVDVFHFLGVGGVDCGTCTQKEAEEDSLAQLGVLGGQLAEEGGVQRRNKVASVRLRGECRKGYTFHSFYLSSSKSLVSPPHKMQP